MSKKPVIASFDMKDDSINSAHSSVEQNCAELAPNVAQGRIVVELLTEDRVAALHLPSSFQGGYIFRCAEPSHPDDLPTRN